MSEDTKVNGFLSQEEKKKLQNIKRTLSGSIGVDTGNTLITAYKDRKDADGNRIPTQLKNSDDEFLNGFYFDFKNGLGEYLKNTDDKIKGIYLAIGEYSGNQGHTLVLYGVLDDAIVGEGGQGNQLKLDLNDNNVYDLCDPCPKRCPVSTIIK